MELGFESRLTAGPMLGLRVVRLGITGVVWGRGHSALAFWEHTHKL